MWKPCAVSSLRSRISSVVPALVLISDGVKAKRSAVISMICRGVPACPAPRAGETSPGSVPASSGGERDDEQRQRERPHQNHHPRPRLNELGASMSALRLRTTE